MRGAAHEGDEADNHEGEKGEGKKERQHVAESDSARQPEQQHQPTIGKAAMTIRAMMQPPKRQYSATELKGMRMAMRRGLVHARAVVGYGLTNRLAQRP